MSASFIVVDGGDPVLGGPLALIQSFERVEREQPRLQPTTTTCVYSIYTVDQRRFVQLDTSGSRQRKIKGKVSQTLQIDENAARQLLAILLDGFPILKNSL